MSTHKTHIQRMQCQKCKKSITYEISILKSYESHNVNVICSDCANYFNNGKYVNFLDLLDGNPIDPNEKTFNFYLSGKKLFVLRKDIRDITLLSKRNERKEKLLNKLKEMKLKYIKGGVCDAHIKFGAPSLDVVIKSMYDKQNDQNERLFNLLNKLRNANAEYDENIPSYKKYVLNGGDLDKIIENGEIEKILINESNYLSVIDSTDSETAKEIALGNYINKGKSDKIIDKYVTKKNTIRFD